MISGGPWAVSLVQLLNVPDAIFFSLMTDTKFIITQNSDCILFRAYHIFYTLNAYFEVR